jgi:putative hydrolase of the HAD superfamily
MARQINPDIPEELIRQAAENRINKFRYALEHPLLEAVEVLARLKGMGKSTGLISNVFPMDICGWAGSPLKPLLDTVVFSCDVGLVKPEPEIYELCLESLGVKPEQSLFVGDGGADELKGARQAGLTPVLATGIRKMLWPETLEAIRKHADYEIENLHELIEFGPEEEK